MYYQKFLAFAAPGFTLKWLPPPLWIFKTPMRDSRDSLVQNSGTVPIIGQGMWLCSTVLSEFDNCKQYWFFDRISYFAHFFQIFCCCTKWVICEKFFFFNVLSLFSTKEWRLSKTILSDYTPRENSSFR